MAIDLDLALERALAEGDEWQSWRALRLSGDDPGPPSRPTAQSDDGSFAGPSGAASPGATGLALCHLVVIGVADSGPARAAAAWLESTRTPALAWLDPPMEVPGGPELPEAGRVWATAAAACGLLAAGRDPGPRALMLLRGEAQHDGGFTGGAYPTFAAAGAFWMAEGPTTEMAEWALRWGRENDDGWGAPELAAALTFWAAARVPLEHPTVDAFVERLRESAAPEGWTADLELTLMALELVAAFEQAA